ncbi:MAG: c-type cytochrome [Candidatus Xenobia bacterium]
MKPPAWFALGACTGCVLTLLVAGLLVWRDLSATSRADSQPSRLERRVADLVTSNMLQHVAPRDNPFPPTVQNLVDGVSAYRESCAGCHGHALVGPNVFAEALHPPAPQFNEGDLALSEAQIVYVAQHGIARTGMPAFHHILSDDDLWKIALFLKRVRQLPPAAADAWRVPGP